MSDELLSARLAAAVWECDRHRSALDGALAEWRGLATPGVDALETDSALQRLTDQILYRFTKLQDAMGERLIPATLGHLKVEEWLAWCDIRNRLAHEYPNEAALRHAAVLATVDAAVTMVAAYQSRKGMLPG